MSAKTQVVITNEGKIAIFVKEGTVADAMQLSNDLYAELQEALPGIALSVQPPEQHRHGPGYEHQHVAAGHHHH